MPVVPLLVAALLLFVRLQVPVLLFVAVLRQVPVVPVLVPSVLPELLVVLPALLAVLPELLVVLPAPL